MLLHEKFEEISFSPSEQVVIDYLLKETEEIETMTTQSIANATFTSKSLIVKIAKKLGYTGWSQLRDALILERDYLAKHVTDIDANYPFKPTDHIVTIAKNIAQLKKYAIDDTLELNSAKSLKLAIAMIDKAEHCHVFAIANNILLAKEFEYNMHRIHKATTVYDYHGDIFFGATLASEKDCALIISYSGETEPLLRVMGLLRRNKVPVILMTSIGENSLSKQADLVLRLSTRERLYSKIATFANDMSITYLLDLLYSGIFAQNYLANSMLRETASRHVEITRPSDSHILMETNNHKSPQ